MKRFKRIALALTLLALSLTLLAGCAVRGGVIVTSIDQGDYTVVRVVNQGPVVVVVMDGVERNVACDYAGVRVGDIVTVASDVDHGGYWVHNFKPQTHDPASSLSTVPPQMQAAPAQPSTTN